MTETQPAPAPAWAYTTGPVPLDAIESQLRAARRASIEKGGACALTLNLVCRAENRADAAALPQRLARLGLRHPARIFLLSEPGSHGTGWAAQSRSSEFIHLEVAPAAAASLVAPLLVADLPTLLWWRAGDPRGNAEFTQLSGLASRLVLDSRQLGVAPGCLAELGATPPLTDLAWTRLTPWRQLLCQATEAHPDARFLDQLVELRLATNDGRANLPAALFAGWLAQQKGWRPEARLGPGKLRVSRPGAAPLTFSLIPPPGKCDAALQAVSLRGQPGTGGIEMRHHRGQLQLTLSDGHAVLGEWTGSTADNGHVRTEAAMLDEELSMTGRDNLFQKSLDAGLALLELWEDASA